MKLSELNAQVDAIRADRDTLHAQLNALLADKAITVGDRETQEAAIRSQIRALNEQVYPMEMERAEIDRVIKGKRRKRGRPWIPQAITLG